MRASYFLQVEHYYETRSGCHSDFFQRRKVSSNVGYIDWLAERMNDLPQYINQEYKKYLKTASNENQHGRDVSSVTWLTGGLKLFLYFALEIGFITTEQQRKILKIGWISFLNNATSQQVEMNSSKQKCLSEYTGSVPRQSNALLKWGTGPFSQVMSVIANFEDVIADNADMERIQILL